MALTLRPSGLNSGIDKSRLDYIVYSSGWDVGRIYETRGGPESILWFWSMTVNGPMTRSKSRGDLGEAQLRNSWEPTKLARSPVRSTQLKLLRLNLNVRIRDLQKRVSPSDAQFLRPSSGAEDAYRLCTHPRQSTVHPPRQMAVTFAENTFLSLELG